MNYNADPYKASSRRFLRVNNDYVINSFGYYNKHLSAFFLEKVQGLVFNYSVNV